MTVRSVKSLILMPSFCKQILPKPGLNPPITNFNRHLVVSHTSDNKAKPSKTFVTVNDNFCSYIFHASRDHFSSLV